MEFKSRLKDLIAESGKHIAEIACDLDVTPQTLYSYLSGKTTAEYRILILIADYFRCSIDYLVGKENEKVFTYRKSPPFSVRLKEVFRFYRTTESKIYKEAGISRSRFHAWLSGKSEPTLYNLIKLAKYFDCSLDFLVGREH